MIINEDKPTTDTPNEAHELGHKGAESAPDAGDQTAKRPVSETKRAANRANAQKSTGPRTERGRQYSRRNAIKHGFFATLSIADLEKAPGYEQLQKILDELGRCYAPKSVAEQILLEKAALDLWRHSRATRTEMLIGNTWVGLVDGISNVLRYVAQAERSVLQSIEVLAQMEEKTAVAEKVAAESKGGDKAESTGTDENEPNSDREAA